MGQWWLAEGRRVGARPHSRYSGEAELRRKSLLFAAILIAMFLPFLALMLWLGSRGEPVAYAFAVLALVPLGAAVWIVFTPGRTRT